MTKLLPPIGLVGKAGSGKDTVGQMIIDAIPAYERVAFADIMKESIAALFGITVDKVNKLKNGNGRIWLYDGDRLITSLTMRSFLQRYGTEAHRDTIGENFWIDRLAEKIGNPFNYVFTDVRLQNEIDYVRMHDGHIIHVVRPGQDVGDKHSTENTVVSGKKYTIVNNTTLKNLRLIVRDILRDMDVL